jgi:predicted Holliday junction resolvase-like endonuclease
MTTEWKIIIALTIFVIILFLLWRRARQRLSDVSYAKQSLSAKYGKMTEQFLPFLADYPYDPQNFRFLGTPIDGVQFNDDGIVFVEFKTADSTLNQRQIAIKKLIKDKKVDFAEIRIAE